MANNSTLVQLNAQDRGGQFTRSALSLSELTGKSVSLTRIKGLRYKNTARSKNLIFCAKECARLRGAEVVLGLKESRLNYWPGENLISGQYDIQVPSNCSISPLIQTILPLALSSNLTASLTLRGCTELKHSAPSDYFANVFFPLLRKFGWKVSLEDLVHGFWNERPGVAKVLIRPSNKLEKLFLLEKGEMKRIVFSINSTGPRKGADTFFAEEMERFVRSLGFSVQFKSIIKSNDSLPHERSSMSIALETEHSFLGADISSDKIDSKDAEKEAFEILKRRTRVILTTNAALDPFSADQILVYLAMSGGAIAIPREFNLDHVHSQLDLINSFRPKLLRAEKGANLIKIFSTSVL